MCERNLFPCIQRGTAAIADSQGLSMCSVGAVLQTLQFQTVQHQVITCDSQPAKDNGILTFVTGKLVVDNNATTPINFAQTFVLYPVQGGSWYVHHDMFRLNYG
uniref:NTF2 domain-containing protein n=1 Tax=Chrysotila carterae TaxID=13221 RepID=A0A7S4B6I0_CHRCT